MTNKDIWLYLKSKGGGGESTNAFTVFNATVKNSEITITGLVDTTTVGDIEIPSKIENASVTAIGNSAFRGCSFLENVIIPNSVTSISNSAFRDTYSIKKIIIPASVTVIETDLFNNSNIQTIILPNTITQIKTGAFNLCRQLEFVTLENGFDCDGLNLSYSTKLTNSIIVSMLNALADRTGQTAYTLALGSTNLVKLSDEEIAIATNKNWTLA